MTDTPHRTSGRSPERPQPDLQVVMRMLRDPRTAPSRLAEIGEDRRWTSYYKVRAALVQRADTPLLLALRLLPSLWWRELARVAGNPRLYPPVRARAEQLLSERIEEMTPGERMSLARVAGRPLIKLLREARDTRVLCALLGNPRLFEDDVLRIVRDESASSRILSTVARHPRWSQCYRVKIALAQDPRCPAPDSLRALRGLPTMDLRRIAQSPATPQLVRVGASRRLAGA